MKCLERTQTLNIPLHRDKRVLRKLRKCAANWFKGTGDIFHSVLFVPSAPFSALAKCVIDCEEQNRQGRLTMIKVVEIPGRTLRDPLVRNYPWDTTVYGDCFQCSTNHLLDFYHICIV